MEILNIFDMESRPTIVKSVVESANSRMEAADFTADFAIIPLKIDLWAWALTISKQKRLPIMSFRIHPTSVFYNLLYWEIHMTYRHYVYDHETPYKESPNLLVKMERNRIGA